MSHGNLIGANKVGKQELSTSTMAFVSYRVNLRTILAGADSWSHAEGRRGIEMRKWKCGKDEGGFIPGD